MTLVVVDASIVLKWFFPERWSEEARALLDHPIGLVAPDLVFAEVGNAVWKRVQRRQLAPTVASALVADFADIAVRPVPSRALLHHAVAIAIDCRVTVYDALYLALAVRLGTRMITADEKLGKAVSAVPALREHLRLVSAPV